MKNLLITTANCYKDCPDQIGKLRESCKILGLNFEPYGGEGWSNWLRMKVQLAKKFLATKVDEYEIVLFTDGADSFLVAPEEDILAGFRSYNSDIIISAERDCWPPNKISATEYPYFPGPFRFANAGGWMGKTQAIVETLEDLEKLSAELGGEDNDQVLWHQEVIRGKVVVDHGCRVFQTMSGGAWESLAWHSKRLRNWATNSYPAALHWNGKLPGIETAWRWFTNNLADDEVEKLVIYADGVRHPKLPASFTYTPDELRCLAKYAVNLPKCGVVVEIGCFMGRSTSIWLGLVKSKGLRVTVVDPFLWEGEEARRGFQETVKGLGLDLVFDLRLLETDSKMAWEAWQDEDWGEIDLLHVDGAHDYPHVRLDCDLWLPKLKSGGIAIFHDYTIATPGVIKAVDESCKGWEELEGAGRVAVRRKP